jgi:hypothetical protein
MMPKITGKRDGLFAGTDGPAILVIALPGDVERLEVDRNGHDVFVRHAVEEPV